MQDSDRIRNLLGVYCDLMDLADWRGIGELFSEAVLVDDHSGTPLAAGADEVEQFYASTVLLHDGRPRTKHLVLNTVIAEPDAEGNVVARSSYLVLQAVAAENPLPIVTGRYTDCFAPGRDDSWGFTERRFSVDLVGDLSQHLRFSIES